MSKILLLVLCVFADLAGYSYRFNGILGFATASSHRFGMVVNTLHRDVFGSRKYRFCKVTNQTNYIIIYYSEKTGLISTVTCNLVQVSPIHVGADS